MKKYNDKLVEPAMILMKNALNHMDVHIGSIVQENFQKIMCSKSEI